MHILCRHRIKNTGKHNCAAKSLQEGAEQEFELNLSNEEANTHVDVKLSCVRTRHGKPVDGAHDAV